MLISVHPDFLPKFGHSVNDVREFLEKLDYVIELLGVDHEEHCVPVNGKAHLIPVVQEEAAGPPRGGETHLQQLYPDQSVGLRELCDVLLTSAVLERLVKQPGQPVYVHDHRSSPRRVP